MNRLAFLVAALSGLAIPSVATAACQDDAMASCTGGVICGDAASSLASACRPSYPDSNQAYLQTIVVPYDSVDVFYFVAGTSHGDALTTGCTYTAAFTTTNLPASLVLTVYGPDQASLGTTTGMSGQVVFAAKKNGKHYLKFELPGANTGTHYTFTLIKGDCCADADKDGYTTCDGDCTDGDAKIHPGAKESCNGKDDDCDGATDEDFVLGAACSAGKGECLRTGKIACTPDGSGTACDAVAGTPVAEKCANARDDDCDGETDEGFDLGAPCTSGKGACERTGVLYCGPDGMLACDAVPGTPGIETCGNGIDDDCDGVIDEGFLVGMDCSAGTGACLRDGKTVCSLDGLSTVCDAVPGTPGIEKCGNGIDDDCDGEIDEGFDVGASCLTGVGACLRTGKIVCSPDGSEAVCDAVAGQPVTELCNGEDDDCDGETDEGFAVGTACFSGKGACQRQGVSHCSPDGTATICDAVPGTPTAEKCNGIDDDCDGATDEGMGFDVGASCSVGTGICVRNGKKVCSPDGFGTVCNAVPGTPSRELCGNKKDDDCDGETDEGYVLGRACTVGIGACARTGREVCSADRLSVVCSATPGTPATELCGNKKDDDCDGETDEGFATGLSCTVGIGVCARTGTLTCSADRLSTVCNARPGRPGTEICGNQKDDDCDGHVDEDCPLTASLPRAVLPFADAGGETGVVDEDDSGYIAEGSENLEPGPAAARSGLTVGTGGCDAGIGSGRGAAAVGLTALLLALLALKGWRRRVVSVRSAHAFKQNSSQQGREIRA